MIIDELLTIKDKLTKGEINELIICDQLAHRGYNCRWLHDNNPNWDLQIKKGNCTNYVECKLDGKATDNLYFEFWNYTNNRPTGINNKNLSSLYCHTFKYKGEWCFIINYRKAFINTLAKIQKEDESKIKAYNKTYHINNKLCGDKAYIVNIETFLKYYQGKIYPIEIYF